PTANELENATARSTDSSESVGDYTRAFGKSRRSTEQSEPEATVPFANVSAAEAPAKSVAEAKPVNFGHDRLGTLGQWRIPDTPSPANEPARTPFKDAGPPPFVEKTASPTVADSPAGAVDEARTEEGGFTKFFYTPKPSRERGPTEDSL